MSGHGSFSAIGSGMKVSQSFDLPKVDDLQLGKDKLLVIMVTTIMERHRQSDAVLVLVEHRRRVQSTGENDQTIFHIPC